MRPGFNKCFIMIPPENTWNLFPDHGQTADDGQTNWQTKAN